MIIGRTSKTKARALAVLLLGTNSASPSCLGVIASFVNIRTSASCQAMLIQHRTRGLLICQANTELSHQHRQNWAQGRASLAGYQSGEVACLARCVSVYFRWLWLTVSHGYRTHKRPVTLWLANYHDGDGGEKRREQEELARNAKGSKKGYRGPRVDAKLGLLSCIGFSAVCLSGLRPTHLPQLWVLEWSGVRLDLLPTAPSCPVALPETLLCLQQIGSAH